MYVPDDVIGAALAVPLIGLVRGLPDRAETGAAEGGACPGEGQPDSSVMNGGL